MYRLGRPTSPKKPKSTYAIELAFIAVVVGCILLAIYWFIIRRDDSAIANNDSPLTSRIEFSKETTKVSEPYFTMELPGKWKEIYRDDGSIMWRHIVKSETGRWLRLYVDTIPTDYAVTYFMPVSADGPRIKPGQISDLCVNFVPGATKSLSPNRKINRESLPAKYQNASFNCDNAHPIWQRVGTSSSGGINTVKITGQKSGTHRYFFVYDDANFRPDYYILTNIIESFRAK